MNKISENFLFYAKTLCLLLSGIGLNAQNYYVSHGDGSDSNNGTEAAPFKTIDRGITAVTAGGTVFVMNGTYQNNNYGSPNPSSTNGALSTNMNNPHVVTINKSGSANQGYITLKNYPSHTPKIQFDGKGGILISGNSSYIIIEGFEVEGPAAAINYNLAVVDRNYKIQLAEDDNSATNYNHSYFSGKGIWGGYTAHNHVIIRNNIVHDTPGSAIRFNDSDHITIENNTVYNATWWTSSASSAIVFAETIAASGDNGTDIKMIMRGNTVYNNWNRILFYVTQLPDNSGNENPNYGSSSFTSIWDGQGLYVTRSDDNYLGTFLFENNLCVNNGKNGINFDHSLGATGIIRNNTIYFNGVHEIIQDMSELEGNTAHRGQKVGGIKANKIKNITVANNIVVTRDSEFSALQLPNISGTKIATNNLFHNGTVSYPGNQEPANIINVAPQFVNAPTTEDDATSILGWANYLDGTDFSLASGSPAIDAGSPNYAPATDINGKSRPSNDSNTISSSSFEGSTGGWTSFGSTVEMSAAEAKSDESSLLTSARTLNWHSPKLDLNGLLTAGETYTFYVWVKLPENATGSAQLVVKRTTGGVSDYDSLGNNTTLSDTEWTRLSADYTYTAVDDSFVYVKGPAVSNGVGVDYYIDDFSLVTQGSPEANFSDAGDIVDIGAFEFQRPLSLKHLIQEVGSIAYPNPTTSTITITNQITVDNIMVFDLLGKQHQIGKKYKQSSKEVILDVSSLRSGIYYVQFNKAGNKNTIKFLKN